ncbi:MAG TPA: rod shape-determining protein MreC [Phenylobacterium sp.]|nr:rod shape-determining protein MreC [Phenylobacterium sp.]HZZ66598.1 rod shape-determining protein MreC [Phenylobacterium sp.]
MSLRDNPLGELKVPLTWAAAIALIVAVVAATAILLSDRRETFKAEAYGVSRKASDTVLAPVGDVLAAPGRWIGAGVDTVRDYFGAASENADLKAQLKVMRQWRDVAIALKDENVRYRTLLGLKTDPPIPMVAARVVTDSHGPFADTRLANAGTEKGVKVGNSVMSENGLVGRVIGVTEGASRVLLLTDIASRTPVMIDRTNARAILTGDGGPNPRLDYLRGRDPIREGDRILTSGDGGVVPRGLPVGTAVKGLDGRWRVVLASDAAPIDFVRILLFEDFTQVIDLKKLAATPAPPPTGGPGATPVTPAENPATTSAPKPAPDAAKSAVKAAQPKAPAANAAAPKTPAKTPAKASADGTPAKSPAAKTTAAKPGDAPSPKTPPKPKPKTPPADGGGA